jgi:hypothetical protein
MIDEGSPVHSAESYRTAKTARRSTADRRRIGEESVRQLEPGVSE